MVIGWNRIIRDSWWRMMTWRWLWAPCTKNEAHSRTKLSQRLKIRANNREETPVYFRLFLQNIYVSIKFLIFNVVNVLQHPFKPLKWISGVQKNHFLDGLGFRGEGGGVKKLALSNKEEHDPCLFLTWNSTCVMLDFFLKIHPHENLANTARVGLVQVDKGRVKYFPKFIPTNTPWTWTVLF